MFNIQKNKQIIWIRVRSICRWLLLCLFFAWGIFYFSLYMLKGYWFASHRADRIDIAPYYTVAQMLHKTEGSGIYNYACQKQFQDSLIHSLIKRSQHNSPVFLNKKDKQFIAQNTVQNTYFYYSPNSVFLFYLLGFLSIEQSYLLINILSLALLACVLFVTIQAFQQKNIAGNFITGFDYFLFGVSLLTFLPFTRSLFHSQLSFSLPLFFFFYYFLSNKNQNFWAGTFLSLTLIKLQFGIFCLAIALFQQNRRPFYWALFVTFLLCLLGFLFIGAQGYKQYFMSTLQLLRIYDFHLFLPPPNHSVYPIKDWITVLLSNSSYCNLFVLSIAQVFVIAFSFLSLLVFFVLLFKQFPCKYNVYKIALLLLLSKFIVPYENTYDYCFLILPVFLFAQGLASHFKRYLLSFVFLASLLPSLLEALFGADLLVNEFHFPIFWIETFLLIIYMFFEVRQAIMKNG